MRRRMARSSVFLGVAFILAATTVSVPTQCIQQPAQNPRISPTGEVVYTTGVADTPWALAERFYGKGYEEYKIRHRNPLFITKEGMYAPGVQIVIPPDDHGMPIDVTRYDRTYKKTR